MITISTRASLKKYHTYNLILGQGDNGDEWEFERIGTEREKLQVEKELQELRERLSKVDEWKTRRSAIEAELAAVWTEAGESLEAPSYAKDDAGEVAEGETEGQETQTEDGRAETEGETASSYKAGSEGVEVEAVDA